MYENNILMIIKTNHYEHSKNTLAILYVVFQLCMNYKNQDDIYIFGDLIDKYILLYHTQSLYLKFLDHSYYF